MRKKMSIEIDLEIVNNFYTNNTIARVYYPDEGNKIQIIKGLNVIEVSESIFHEIGHLIDWYISNGKQSKSKKIREENAVNIGESLRFKTNKI